jgi:hypothetical protein
MYPAPRLVHPSWYKISLIRHGEPTEMMRRIFGAVLFAAAVWAGTPQYDQALELYRRTEYRQSIAVLEKIKIRTLPLRRYRTRLLHVERLQEGHRLVRESRRSVAR